MSAQEYEQLGHISRTNTFSVIIETVPSHMIVIAVGPHQEKISQVAAFQVWNLTWAAESQSKHSINQLQKLPSIASQ